MKKYHEIIESKYFIGFLALVAFISWITNIPYIAMSIYFLIAWYILLFNGPTKVFIPILINLLFISRTDYNLNDFPVLLTMGGIISLVLIIYYLIRYKIDLKKCNLKLSFLLFAICSVISLINLDAGDEPIRYFLSLAPVLYLFIYIFLAGSIKEDQSSYLCISMIASGFIMSLEFITAGVVQGNLFYEVVDFAWYGPNTMGIYLNMIIIAIAYLIVKTDKLGLKIAYYSAIMFFYSVIYIGHSRGAIVSILIYLFPTIGLVIKGSTNRKHDIPLVCICLTIALISIFLTWDVILFTFNIGFHLNGREVLWPGAIKEFLNHPIIGQGLFSDSITYLWETNKVLAVHNTYIQTLLSFGVIGAFVYIFHTFEKIKLIFKNKHPFIKFLLVIWLAATVHGCLDSTMYMIGFMMYYICIFAVVDNLDVGEENGDLCSC